MVDCGLTGLQRQCQYAFSSASDRQPVKSKEARVQKIITYIINRLMLCVGQLFLVDNFSNEDGGVLVSEWKYCKVRVGIFTGE